MQRFVPWPDGYRFDQSRVESFQQALAASNYFDQIEISRGEIDATTLRVPLKVVLSPNLRTRYVAGVSYGTDEGAGVRGGSALSWHRGVTPPADLSSSRSSARSCRRRTASRPRRG
mgnify:CR=1 FL=1